MSESDSDFSRERKAIIQRLATLQRLRDEAKKRNRASMLHSLDKIIELEARILRETRNTDSEPA